MIPRRRAAGFTLLECLVAVTLLALLFGALMPVFRQGLEVLRLGDAHTRAALLGESLLADGAVPGATGAEPASGTVGGMRWQLSRAVYDSDALGEIADDAPLGLVEITATVTWDDGAREIVLRTLVAEPRS